MPNIVILSASLSDFHYLYNMHILITKILSLIPKPIFHMEFYISCSVYWRKKEKKSWCLTIYTKTFLIFIIIFITCWCLINLKLFFVSYMLHATSRTNIFFKWLFLLLLYYLTLCFLNHVSNFCFTCCSTVDINSSAHNCIVSYPIQTTYLF